MKVQQTVSVTLEGDEVKLLWSYLCRNFIENETSEKMYRELSRYLREEDVGFLTKSTNNR